MKDESDRVQIDETADGVILPVQAQPRAKRPGIVGVHAGRLKVAVAQPPEQGRANAAIVRLLADALGLKRQQIELSTGASSSQKKFFVAGIDRDTLQRRLDELLQQTRNSG